MNYKDAVEAKKKGILPKDSEIRNVDLDPMAELAAIALAESENLRKQSKALRKSNQESAKKPQKDEKPNSKLGREKCSEQPTVRKNTYDLGLKSLENSHSASQISKDDRVPQSGAQGKKPEQR